tara:strand:- start:1392 stop:2846 length:1455 start_codon:yes stop_codon:yes gene_type:complete
MAKYADLLAAQGDGLIHFWAMEETSGASVADLIGGWNAECFAINSLTAGEYDATVVTTPAGRGRDLSVNWDGTYQDRTSITVIRIDQAPAAPSLSALTLRVRYFQRTNLKDTYSAMDLALFLFGRGSANAVYLSSGGGSFFVGAGGSDDTISDPFTDGQWHDVILTGDSSSIELYVNGSLITTFTGSSTFDIYDDTGTSDSCLIGAEDFDGGAVYDDDSVLDGIIQDAAIWNRKLTSTEVASLNTDGTAEPLITDISPITYDVALNATLPIEAEFTVQVNPAEVSLDVTFPINFRAVAYQDWVSKLPPVEIQEVYQLVITGAQDGLDDLVIGGISSWQATNQAGTRSAYVQAVIPAADQYVADIEARSNGELVIQKGYKLATGQVQYEEILRSAFDDARPDQGRSSVTLTVSGYMRGRPVSNGNRVLTGIRSTSKPNGKRRVLCDIDLFLQPGMTVTALNESFQADYINYYVNDTDKFCEVGER